MNPGRGHPTVRPAPSRELAELRARLAEAEETLRAIRTGEVDALVVEGKGGRQVFTLQGAEHAYRALIESMNEGALTLNSDLVILYANRSFAKMVHCPLEEVMGSLFQRFLSPQGLAALRSLLRKPRKAGAKLQAHLNTRDGSRTPAQISIRPLSRNGLNPATVSMVVTDMTEARRTEARLRALTRRVVEVQESERSRVALELHDHITQLLCAVLARFETLANGLPPRAGRLKAEVLRLRKLLGQAAEEVERISSDLRPSALDDLGLVVVLRETTAAFAKRTGWSVDVTCTPFRGRLPADTELTVYRILQEALKNAEKHARASRVTVDLTRQRAFVQLVVHDDGIGFDPDRHPLAPWGEVGLGLLGMHERAASAGGALKVTSAPGAGTEVQARIPLPTRARPRDGQLTNRGG